MPDFIPEGQEHLYPARAKRSFGDFIPDPEAEARNAAIAVSETAREANEFLKKLPDCEENATLRRALQKLIIK